MLEQIEINEKIKQDKKRYKSKFIKEQYLDKFEYNKYYNYLEKYINDYALESNIKKDDILLCRNENTELFLDILTYHFKLSEDKIYKLLNHICPKYICNNDGEITRKNFNKYMRQVKDICLYEILKDYTTEKMKKFVRTNNNVEFVEPESIEEINYDFIKIILKKDNYSLYDLQYIEELIDEYLPNSFFWNTGMLDFHQSRLNRIFNSINFNVPLKNIEKKKILLKEKKVLS